MTDQYDEIAVAAVRRHGALQKPAELAGLLRHIRPAGRWLVLEIGSDTGGTLWAWRQLGAEVIAVSLPDGPFGTGRPLRAHDATVIEGDSHTLATWLQVERVLAGRRADLLFIDGDHTEPGVTADLMAYSQFVEPGGLVALHDICPHARPDVGVRAVWQHLAALPGAAEFVAVPETWGGIGAVPWPPHP